MEVNLIQETFDTNKIERRQRVKKNIITTVVNFEIKQVA